MNAPARTPFGELPAPQQAGILCNDPRFQKFAAARCGLKGASFSNSAAKQYIYDVCKITSRRELATDQYAHKLFEDLRTEFDAWIGRIGRPQ